MKQCDLLIFFVFTFCLLQLKCTVQSVVYEHCRPLIFFKWDNLHNWWLQNTFFPALCTPKICWGETRDCFSAQRLFPVFLLLSRDLMFLSLFLLSGGESSERHFQLPNTFHLNKRKTTWIIVSFFLWIINQPRDQTWRHVHYRTKVTHPISEWPIT